MFCVFKSFQVSRVSGLQGCRVYVIKGFEELRFRECKILMFWGFMISGFQGFKVSRLQSFEVWGAWSLTSRITETLNPWLDIYKSQSDTQNSWARRSKLWNIKNSKPWNLKILKPCFSETSKSWNLETPKNAFLGILNLSSEISISRNNKTLNKNLECLN
jgi:hypothetical protein